jgi:hypothetical protein
MDTKQIQISKLKCSKRHKPQKAMETKNKSEKLFEQYLDQNGFQGKWEHEPTIEGKRKKPDYMLIWKGNKCFFEVKELRKKPNEPSGKAMYFNPYPSLRSEIDEARKKFKEYKDPLLSRYKLNNNSWL